MTACTARFTNGIDLTQIHAGIQACRAAPEQVANILLWAGPSNGVLAQFPGTRFTYTMFETDRLPAHWPEGLNISDLTFTPSAWGRQVMIDAGSGSPTGACCAGGRRLTRAYTLGTAIAARAGRHVQVPDGRQV